VNRVDHPCEEVVPRGALPIAHSNQRSGQRWDDITNVEGDPERRLVGDELPEEEEVLGEKRTSGTWATPVKSGQYSKEGGHGGGNATVVVWGRGQKEEGGEGEDAEDHFVPRPLETDLPFPQHK
jgi:hypothetical protein